MGANHSQHTPSRGSCGVYVAGLSAPTEKGEQADCCPDVALTRQRTAKILWGSTVTNAIAPIYETIKWISVADELPDAGVTVLLFHPSGSEPVWPGYFEGCGRWFESFYHN